MKNHNFIISNVDTDGISFCKPDSKRFTDDEIDKLVKEINTVTGEKIIWEYEEQVNNYVVIKTKNYAYWDGESLSIKGSALKATQKEPALREMLHRMIKSLLEITNEDLVEIYNEYVKEATNVKDIKRWGAKKSVTSSVLKPSRTNEQKLLDAIQGKGLQIGEKFYVFFRPDNTLATIEDFDGNYNEDKLLEKIYKTVDILKTVVNVKETFPNYKLKKNKKELDKLIGRVVTYKRDSKIKREE